MRVLTFALTVGVLLSGCVVPSDYSGNVVSFNGSMVEIEAAMNQPEGMKVAPTEGMTALATETCNGPVRFAGWSDTRRDQSIVANSFITYRFLCV